MERALAILLTLIIFIIMFMMIYFGAYVRLWSSIILCILISIILLNIFYPLSQVTMDEPDFSLLLYAIIQIGGILLLIIYITQKTITDVRRQL